MKNILLICLLLLSCVATKKIRQTNNGLPPKYWCFEKPCHFECCALLGCTRFNYEGGYTCQFVYAMPYNLSSDEKKLIEDKSRARLEKGKRSE